LAIDANFKLKGKDRKLSDVEMMPGFGVFVEESKYQTHLQNYVDQPEVQNFGQSILLVNLIVIAQCR
jgi:hypothetical protein